MITILADIGNKGFALPMVQAYPVDVNSQYLLAWNPTEQALDYIPYIGNSLGDFGVTRDLTVTRDLAVGRNVTVVGNTTITGATTVAGSLIPNGGIAPADGSLEVIGTLAINGGQVLGSRKTGWTAATGVATRTTFVTSTVTLPQLAEHVKALIDDLIQGTGHGMIGP